MIQFQSCCVEINFIEMSRRAASNKMNTSIGQSTMSNNNPTVITAIRKLKQESEILLREHKRYRVLNHQISRENIKQVNKAKQQMFFNSVKQSADLDKEIKKNHERKKIEEVKKRFTVNLRQREENKKMIQNVRRSFHNANHELYQQIRSKRTNNQDFVRSRKSFVIQSRVSSRQKAEEQERNRRMSIQNFRNSRVQSYRQAKQQQVQDLIRKSEQKRKFYEAMSSRNSRIRENKLSMSRSSSMRSNRSHQSNRSLHNPNPENKPLEAQTRQ